MVSCSASFFKIINPSFSIIFSNSLLSFLSILDISVRIWIGVNFLSCLFSSFLGGWAWARGPCFLHLKHLPSFINRFLSSSDNLSEFMLFFFVHEDNRFF